MRGSYNSYWIRNAHQRNHHAAREARALFDAMTELLQDGRVFQDGIVQITSVEYIDGSSSIVTHSNGVSMTHKYDTLGFIELQRQVAQAIKEQENAV